MIKTEESKSLDLVVYSEYSGELTNCYLPLYIHLRMVNTLQTSVE